VADVDRIKGSTHDAQARRRLRGPIHVSS
jgi:hypothetical protein